jgi:lipoate-protein ligase A
MEKEWRLVNHWQRDGYFNMAVDEALIDFYRRDKIPILRLYQWSEPFITLGCNQSAGQVLLDGVDNFTRRITGGSAILHNHELTYSLVCSKDDLLLNGNVKETYKKLSSFLITFYSRLGLRPSFACDEGGRILGNYGNICFASREHYDILIEGKKIGGNAQKRGRDFIFQHGSIPWDIDFKLMDKSLNVCVFDKALVGSLREYLDKDADFNGLRNVFIGSFKEKFNVRLVEYVLSDEDEVYCQNLMERKYLTDAWKRKA